MTTGRERKSPRKKRPAGSVTPMMEQYLGIKAQVPDCLLLYRMGDFYETFYDDAVTLSKVLGIALTSRNRDHDDPIPLAGIPWHSAELPIAKLLQAGLRVAICEQVESAAEAKGLVERRIVEVLSPGTAVTDRLLEQGRNNYLAALCGGEGRIGLAAADISTGAFLAGDLSEEETEEELARLAPAELLLPEGWSHPRLDRYLSEHHPKLFRTDWDAWRFTAARGEPILREHFRVATLEGFGFREVGPGIGAAAALLEYAREQKQSTLTHLNGLERLQPSGSLVLDDPSLRGLEILEPLMGVGDGGTLLSSLDRTRTSAGGRRLRAALTRPYRDPEPAQRRLDLVESLINEPKARERIGQPLREISDIERILGRVHCSRAHPRDLAGLRRSLVVCPDIAEALPEGEIWAAAHASLAKPVLAEPLDAALVDSPPLSFQEEVFRDGFDAELDSLRDASRGGKQWMAELEVTERQSTGIPNLKVGYNRVFGYYLEVSKSQLARVPERYTRKQTLSTGERYVTPELKQQEEKILGAQEAHTKRQADLFKELCARVAEETNALQAIARGVAEIDLVLSFAEVAAEGGYTRPRLERSHRLLITEGRHPVVEQAIGTDAFVPNDVALDGEDKQVVILTGPNMAGKSTYLRQIGLIVLMAQAGSMVPASEATIGMVDRIFTRVGAHDILARGQSTFLVEMIETSNILRHATSESLVLMDEVGRGTSTYDGVSIAWAVAEALRETPDRRPRTIFATHYHELTRLGAEEGYQNLNVLVREWGDEVIFLRRVAEGAADRSYGIEVARLAGVPGSVVRRATEILKDLERKGAKGVEIGVDIDRSKEEQLPLFGPGVADWLLEELRDCDADRLTPLDALNLIHRWLERIDHSRG